MGRINRIHKGVKSGLSSVASYANADIRQLRLTWTFQLLTQAGLTALKYKRLTDTSEKPSESDFYFFFKHNPKAA